ncbi:Pogo transposable element with KRAB domain [Exaiptasia diaphana]|nr:Pogo transposable element with KRAB domain [Exaiptasia diaphana]
MLLECLVVPHEQCYLYIHQMNIPYMTTVYKSTFLSEKMALKSRPRLIHRTFPRRIAIHCHPKGWMDEDGVKLWIEKVWNARPGALSKPKSLLVLDSSELVTVDSFSAHLIDSVKRNLKVNNTDVAVIPGGLTILVQPLDVCLNKPFKDRMRTKWADWMVNGEKKMTKGGAMKAASLESITEWVEESWKEVAADRVERSFKKCCISNAIEWKLC